MLLREIEQRRLDEIQALRVRLEALIGDIKALRWWIPRSAIRSPRISSRMSFRISTVISESAIDISLSV